MALFGTRNDNSLTLLLRQTSTLPLLLQLLPCKHDEKMATEASSRTDSIKLCTNKKVIKHGFLNLNYRNQVDIHLWATISNLVKQVAIFNSHFVYMTHLANWLVRTGDFITQWPD